MRKLLYTSFLLISYLLKAQSPVYINYQGMVRDNEGKPIVNRSVGLEFRVLQAGSPVNTVFTEIHSANTNSLGLFSLRIGSNQNLGTVDFSSGTYSLQVSLDADNTGSYVVMGDPQLLVSVPYALHANTVPASFTNNVLTIGNRSFTLAPYSPTLSLSGADNNLLSDGTNTVTLNSYTVGSGLSMSGGPNYTISAVASNPTISGSGLAVVNPTTGNAFTVAVPAPTLSSNGNSLTITQGTAVSTATIPAQIQSSVSGAGIATVSSTGTNSFVVTVPAPSISINSNTITVTQGSAVTSITVPVPPQTSVSGTGMAAVTPVGINSFVVNVPVPSLSANSNSLSFTQGTVVNNVSIPAMGLNASGILTVSAAGTNTFNAGVPAPVLSSNANTVTLTQGAAVTTATVPLQPPTNVTSTGIGTVSSLGTNSFAVNIPPPVLSSSNHTLTITQGTAVSSAAMPVPQIAISSTAGAASVSSASPSSFTINVPPAITPSISGAGIASVSPASGNSFTVSVDQPTFAYSQTTGSLTSGTSSAYITPTLVINGGTISSGPASNSVAINTGTTAMWFTQGNAGTNPTLNFIGTTDNVALNFRVNNIRSGLIQPGAGFNTMFGFETFISNTSGSSNVGIGAQALRANTTGFSNSAVGAVALINNTTGNYNSALGNQALTANTTGNFNSALGAGALRNNTTAGNNSAFGYEALNLNTTGNDNSAFGMYALRSNTIGIANAGIGGAALFNNTSGNFNTSVGHNVLYNNTTGNNNVAIGAYSGYNNTIGSGNVFIGTNAGYFETGSNKLYISNNTTSVSPLVYGDFATGNLAIGTTNANAPLQFSNSVVNRKIVLYENTNNDHQYYGFGINGATLRYQVDSQGADHVFFAGTGAATSQELFRIKGTGMFKMGTETGTNQPPVYPGGGGMMIRRIFTSNSTAGAIVARTDNLQFERDGSNGGFRINLIGGSGLQVCNCMATTNTGVSLNRALNNLPGGVTTVYTNLDNVVYLHCILGDPYGAGHITEVTLTRQFPDFFWVGTVMTTFNQ